MSGWKTSYKVSDLSDKQQLELICRQCNRLAYTNKSMLCEKIDRSHLYLDEIEKRARCKARGCGGLMRLSMVRLDELSGFVGGMA